MRNRLILLGDRDVLAFCMAASECDGNVLLTDESRRQCVSGKSIMGCMLAMTEWREIWVETEKDCYTKLEKWIETAADDGNFIHE